LPSQDVYPGPEIEVTPAPLAKSTGNSPNDRPECPEGFNLTGAALPPMFSSFYDFFE
jgi:hypothetical protein